MRTNSKAGNEVRDYFIQLRKFIHYYKNNISNMILKSKNVVYLFTVNKKKKIFKFGQTKDLRARLYGYMTGREKHPDIDFIMQVNDPISVENCVKGLVKNNIYKRNKELYHINFDSIRYAIFNCAIVNTRMKEINQNNVDTYILFDNSKLDDKIIFNDQKKLSKKASRKSSRKVTRKASKKTSKKVSRKLSR
jgi:hypothetical protein